MSGKKSKSKIIAPSEDEVRQYGGTSESEGAEAAETVEAHPRVPSTPPEEDAAELKDKLLRARAELANVQRRAANEKAEALRFAIADFVRDLLVVVDDFERALEAAESAGESGGMVAGARLVYENLLKVLSNHHLERIEAEGQPFDPTWHEAVMQKPSAEHAPHTVLQVVQQGYRLHDRLIRPAKVVVSCEPSSGDEAGESEGGSR
ncbi:MAG: nucleotide exchange factor GrpE [Phycisphaerales bacterium]|nr:MAG: nucleotide exchange factor GrpE [Phycisphaerales bacterium]